MNTVINIIIIALLIGLIIFIYFALVKKLSNNYKVLILPFITLINSIIFGNKAYSNGDDITLIIWLVIFLTSLLSIVLVFRKIYSEKYKPVQTIINNTEINHNHPTNIDTINYSKTFQNSQTNIHLEQNNITDIDTVDNSTTLNNVQNNYNANIDLKQDVNKKENDANSRKKTINSLSDEQLRKIYNFFIDNNLLVDENLKFENFKEIFLKEPIRLKADIPTLREFYNHLSVQNNIKFIYIKTDFLGYFINSKIDEFYDYKQFTKDSRPISILSDEILELFEEF